MRKITPAGLIVLALLAAGCAANAGESATSYAVAVQDGPRGGTACGGTTTIEGTLASTKRWLIGLTPVGADAGTIRGVLWPRGYAARATGPSLELVNQDGRAVATVGDRVRIGGRDGVDGVWLACRDTPAVVSP